MNLKEAQKYVQAIRDMAGDDELAHSFEDSLYCDFAIMVAQSDSEFSEIAKEICKTMDIDFARRCA